jgi:hypothetical protein
MGARAQEALPGRYVTRDVARKAIDLTLPMLEAGRADPSVVGSGFLHIVVMDPFRPPGCAGFEEAILYEHSLGDPGAWDADYRSFARAKAQLSWETGLSSHEVQTLRPHLLWNGATALWGSACLDGIVVAISGAFPWFDEAYACAIACMIRALAKAARESDAGKLFLD